MRAINKGTEPRVLSQHRSQPHSTFDNLPLAIKDKIRAQLCDEQGYLCAYCMQRIENDSGQVKIEHWCSQTRYPAEQLDYANLLGVCLGNEGQQKQQQHCDTRKGDADLDYHPANPAHHIESRIHYEGNGTISSREALFDQQLNEVLNLNLYRIRKNREGVIRSISEAMNRRPGSRSRAEVLKFLEKWQRPDAEGKLKPYCGVAIYWLNKRLQKAQ